MGAVVNTTVDLPRQCGSVRHFHVCMSSFICVETGFVDVEEFCGFMTFVRNKLGVGLTLVSGSAVILCG